MLSIQCRKNVTIFKQCGLKNESIDGAQLAWQISLAGVFVKRKGGVFGRPVIPTTGQTPPLRLTETGGRRLARLPETQEQQPRNQAKHRETRTRKDTWDETRRSTLITIPVVELLDTWRDFGRGPGKRGPLKAQNPSP